MQQVGGQVAVLGDPVQHVLGGEAEVVGTLDGSRPPPRSPGSPRRAARGRASSTARSCSGRPGSGCSRRRSVPLRWAIDMVATKKSGCRRCRARVELLDVRPDVLSAPASAAPRRRPGSPCCPRSAASAADRRRPAARPPSRAARAVSTMVIPSPGSRSTTTRSASGSPAAAPSAPAGSCRRRPAWPNPVHCGTCSSRAARFANQTRVVGSSATTYVIVPSEVSIRAVRTQAGVPSGAFFS